MKTLTALPALLLTLVLALPALAGDLDDVVDVDLLPGWRTAEGTHMAGLRIRLAPGWKTYWRAPGDAGIPPSFDWRGSRNIDGARLHWPVPEVFHQNGMRSVGYRDEVVIPLEFALSEDGAPTRIEGEVEIGVCHDICVPVALNLSALLPATGPRDAEIVAALVDRPRTRSEAGVGAVSCSVDPAGTGVRITARIEMAQEGGEEVVVIEPGNPALWAAETQTHREGDSLIAVTEVEHSTGGPVALDRSAVRLTVLSAGGAVDIRGCG